MTPAEVEYLDLDSVAKLVNDFENPKLSEEENASAEQDLTNVSENETRFSKSNENQRIFVSNIETAVVGIKQEKDSCCCHVRQKNGYRREYYSFGF